MKKIGFGLFFSLCILVTGYWLLVSGVYAQEQIEILTYYPAPYGVYQTLEVTNQDPNPDTSLTISYFSNDSAHFPLLNFRRANNTMADPESIPTNTWLGSIYFSGCDNSATNNFDIGARIYAISAAAWSLATRPTNLRFATSDANGTLSDRMTIDAAGNVGIGTVSPGITGGAQRYLTISIPTPTPATNTNEVSSLELKGQSFQSIKNPIGKIDFIQRIRDGAAASANIARIAGVTADWDGEGELLFYTKNIDDPSPQERMRIDKNGNVGIGEATPTAKLHVNGNIKCQLNDVSNNYPLYSRTTGLDSELGYDLAELFETDEEVEQGDILIIDGNGKLKKSDKLNDAKVAGVVSSAPAILFEGSELQIAPEPFKFEKGTKPPVALAGRVLCKVDASYGEIQPGDLLTTSPTPGHAMKAKPIGEINGYPIYPQGCIVGKALEGLKEGKGKILVLVCLM